MSYKRSTTFTGYKNRTVDKSEIVDQINKAKVLDTQRKETVKEFGQQATNQVTEMTRLSDLEAKADKYELENLAKFSKALTTALDVGAKTLGVEYINRKRQEGLDNHRNALAGDKEALAKTQLDAKQLAEIETRLKELETERGQALSEVEKNNITMSMEERFRLENAKKYGTNFAYGYQKATLLEGAKGFMPWFQTEITTSEETITITLDNGEEKEIKISDYNTLTTSTERKQVEDKLLVDYINKVNNTTLSNLVVDQVLSKSLVEQLTRWRSLQLDQEVKTNAADALEKKHIDIHNSITNFDGSDEAQFSLITASVQDVFTNGRALQISKGVTAAAGLTNREEIKEVIIDALASIDDEQLREEIAEQLFRNTEFTVPGIGTGFLDSDVFGGAFDKDQIMIDIAYKIEQNKEKENVKNKAILKSSINTLKYQLNHNEISQTQYFQELTNLEETLGLQVDNGMQLISNARGYEKEILSVTNGRTLAEQELEKYGVITEATFVRLPAELQEEYEGRKADGLLWFETDSGAQIITDFATNSKNELTQIYSGALTSGDSLSTKSTELNNAIDFANDIYVWQIARQLEADPSVPPPPDGVDKGQYYFELATKSILAQIQNAGDPSLTVEQNPFALTLGGSVAESKFKNPAFNYDNLPYNIADINIKEVINLTDLAEAERKIFASQDGANLFENGDLLDHIPENRLREILQFKTTEDGIWASESGFLVKLALLDPQKRDVFTLGEMLRKQYIPDYEGIDLTTLPQETQLIIEQIKNSDLEIRTLLASPYAHDNTRGFDMLGKVDNFSLMNSMVGLGFGINNLDDGTIADILGGENVNITREDFDNNVDGAQDKVLKIHLNNLLKEAANYTDNKLVMIQMVAIGMKDGDMKNDYGSIKYKNLMNESLVAYYTGFSLSDESQLYSAFERGLDGQVKITNMDGVSIENPTVTPAVIEAKINDHLSIKPEQYLEGSTNKINPQWKTWNAKMTQLNAQRDVIDLLSDPGYADIKFGMGRSLLPSDTDSHFAWYAVMEALGGRKNYIDFLDDTSKKFIEQTQYSISPRSWEFSVTVTNRKEIMDAWSDFVRKELLLKPEFFNLEVAENE